MIIREHDKAFVMIEQDHHADVSASIIKQWKDVFFKGDPLYMSVFYAIKHHDYGWRLFDQQPFWNDEKQSPYSFIDFPILPKTVLYMRGIDEVEECDPYAALLCSAHYARFIPSSDNAQTEYYIKHEEARRERLMNSLSSEQLQNLNKHIALLQLADNLSLYICLNEPGISKEEEHFFFQEGIPFQGTLNDIPTDLVKAHWTDEQTVILQDLPYVSPFSVSLATKVLLKQEIKENGLLAMYESTPYTHEKIQFVIES